MLCGNDQLVYIQIQLYRSGVFSDCPPGRCLLDPVSGICEAYNSSYFYNATSGQCERFVYGGCGGNENRFSSGLECLRACDPDSKHDQHLIYIVSQLAESVQLVRQ